MAMRAAALLLLTCACGAQAGSSEYAHVPAGRYESVLPVVPGNNVAQVPAFLLQRRPVTNGDFLAFVRKHPQWRRDHAPPLFVDAAYLRHWQGPLSLGAGTRPTQPVVNVSWFAASAYCEAQGARLPTWHEWEWSAAADETRTDARDDPAWRQRILNWYAEPGSRPLAVVGRMPPNVHGIHDLHGLIWEWVEDYGAMMVSGDNREQGDPDLMKFCGSGALTMEQKEHYAVLMRIAMLSSLDARGTTANLGFRCARDLAEHAP